MRRLTRAALIGLVVVGCATPSEPRPNSDCAPAGACDGIVRPLTAEAVAQWEHNAVVFVHTRAINGELGPAIQKRAQTFDWYKQPVPYDHITWEPCWFTTRGGICAAGLTVVPDHIYISTMEPNRTGPLVAHETTHVIYAALGVKDGDPDHKLLYPY